MKLLSKPYHYFVGETYDSVLFYNYIVRIAFWKKHEEEAEFQYILSNCKETIEIYVKDIKSIIEWKYVHKNGYFVQFINNLLVNKMWTIYIKTMSGKDFDGDSCYAISMCCSLMLCIIFVLCYLLFPLFCFSIPNVFKYWRLTQTPEILD